MLLLKERIVFMAKINIEVVYANEIEQMIIALAVNQPCTIENAIQISEVLTLFPEIDLTKNKVGIFSKVVPLTQLLKDGDRVEIYRGLLIDPKAARINRAKLRK